ncbi:MAG: Cna B-type domain-containing protein [Ruminococcus sp.]|nr:Cna B-type domain-containing protein [Ruminococcus sp.]
MKSISRFFSLIIFLIVAIIMGAVSFVAVNAYEGNTAKLSIKLNVDGEPVENINISVYRVFEPSSDFNTQYDNLTEKFKGYPINSVTDTDDLRNLAVTIEGYIAADNILPDFSSLTNQYGTADFENLPAGIYLVSADSFKTATNYVFPTSGLISVPKYAENTDQNTVLVDMKYEKQPIETKTSIEAIKVWQDGNSSTRPESVSVSLYCDGKLYQNAVLSKENNWQYKWSDLDPGCKWVVTETKVPSNYKVSVSKQDNCFVVTNSTDNSSPKVPSGTLPQTGMLIWPIPVLFALGAVLIVVGLIIKRGKK